MSDPLVSVIVPVFNRERFVAEALESVFAQDYRPLEVIVVDDGSSDGSAEVARSFEQVDVIELEENLGPAVARNVGLERSTGRFLAFLDADDLMAPGRLSTQLGHLRAHPRVGCALVRQELLLEPGMEVPSWLAPAHAPDKLVDVHVMSAMIRRSASELVGGFDPRYRTGEDLDWLFRLREKGVVVDILPVVGTIRRIHANNLSARRGSVGPPLVRALREHLDRGRSMGTGSGT